jgi:hypothetical protein
MTIERIGLAEARRMALAAQGFAARRPERAGARRVAGAIERMGLLQLDSVNVLARSHYLPVFARVGAYDQASLDARAFDARRRTMFEYWAHEASLLPLALHPLLRWRMARAERLQDIYSGLAKFARENGTYVASVLAELRARGPLCVSDLSNPGPRRTPGWWGWNEGKAALEYLFCTGQVTAHSRRNFERVYDLTERALPAEILALPTPREGDAQRELIRIAARALGVATETDLRDYFRLPVADTKARIAELVEAGELAPTAVETWRHPAYRARDATAPRRVHAAALLSPFDPLIWERTRTERLFGFHYRIALYTPAHKRVHGYYVLPFLLGERLVARVDLKSDRQEGVLRALAAHGEPDIDRPSVAAALAQELARMARWLGLGRVAIGARGDLARELRRAARPA